MTSIIPQSNNNFVLPNSLSITWLNALTIPSAGLGIKSNVTTTYAPKADYNDMEHGKDNVEGSLCGYEWLTPVAYEQMCEGLKTVSMLGLEGDFNYRKNGNYVNVCGFIKRGQ